MPGSEVLGDACATERFPRVPRQLGGIERGAERRMAEDDRLWCSVPRVRELLLEGGDRHVTELDGPPSGSTLRRRELVPDERLPNVKMSLE